MQQKNGRFLIWWNGLENEWFRNSTKETDGYLNKIRLFIRQAFAVIVDSLIETKIISHSAAMTYFTLMVSVPFVAIIIMMSNEWLALSGQMNLVINYTLGNNIYERIEQSALSSISHDKEIYGGYVIFAMIMTFFFIRSFFIGLQRELNQTWGCGNRLFPATDIVNVVIAVCLLAGIALWGWILPLLSGLPVCSLVLSALVVGVLVWGAFYFIPNSRKVGVWPSLTASAICSVTLVLLWRLIPRMPLRFDGYRSLAVLFTALFIIFLSWFIFFVAAELCSVWDRSNDKYLKGDIRQMAPFYKDTLMIFTVAYVFRTFLSTYRRVTMDQIRRGMFASAEIKNAVKYDKNALGKLVKGSRFRDIYQKGESFTCVFTDEFDQKKMVVTDSLEKAEAAAESCKTAGWTHLPVSIMNEILDTLVRQNVLDYEDSTYLGKIYRQYFPKGEDFGPGGVKARMDPNTATVGDLMFQLHMSGRHSLKYRYVSNGDELITRLRDAEIELMRDQKQLLKDLVVTIDTDSIVADNRNSIEEELRNLLKGTRSLPERLWKNILKIMK